MKTIGKRVVGFIMFALFLCSNVYAAKCYSLFVKNKDGQESVFMVDPSLVVRVNAGNLEIESNEKPTSTLYQLSDVEEIGYKEESGIPEAHINTPSVYLSGSVITILSPIDKNIEYTLTDIKGIVVEKGYVRGTTEIDTAVYPAGVYMLKVDKHKGLKFIVR